MAGASWLRASALAFAWQLANGVRVRRDGPAQDADDLEVSEEDWRPKTRAQGHVTIGPNVSDDELRGSALLEHLFLQEKEEAEQRRRPRDSAEVNLWRPLTVWRQPDEPSAPKLIYYNGRYGSPGEGPVRGCSSRCIITHNHSDMPDAAAMIVNEAGVLTNRDTDLPRMKPPGQKWIFSFWFEAPSRNFDWEVMKRREIAYLDANNSFDWTMTHKVGSDFLYPFESMKRRPQSRSAPWLAPPENWNTRPKLLLSFVSNCEGERMVVLKRLKELLGNNMDIFGRCGDKFPPCPGRNESTACYQRLFSQYRFYAAFENKRFSGYISEKLFRGLSEGMVPLALGGLGRQDYEAIGVPKTAMLHMDDFSNTHELVHFLHNSSEDKQYARYFDWRKDYRIASQFEMRNSVFCDVCKELHKSPQQQRPSRRWGSDLTSWWFDQPEAVYNPDNRTGLKVLSTRKFCMAARKARLLGPSIGSWVWNQQ